MARHSSAHNGRRWRSDAALRTLVVCVAQAHACAQDVPTTQSADSDPISQVWASIDHNNGSDLRATVSLREVAPELFAPRPQACFERQGYAAHESAGELTALRFEDIGAAAGINNGPPQTRSRTSPRCLFPQYDVVTKQWNAGAFCVPELLTGGAAAGDVNHDGWPDLYITRLDAPDSLYINNGDGTFTDVALTNGLANATASIRSNGVVIADFDNDGNEDIFISTLGDTRLYMFMSDGAGGFYEDAIARGVALSRPAVAMGEGGVTASFSIAVGDMDGDGFLDMYTTEWFARLAETPEHFSAPGVADAAAACRLLRNRGSAAPGYFDDVTQAAGLRVTPAGIGMGTKNFSLWFSEPVQSSIIKELQQAGLSETEVRARMRKLHREAAAMEDVARRRQNQVDQFMQRAVEMHQSEHKVSAHFLNSGTYIGVFQFGATMVDLNGDGAPELLISGDFGTSQLYWNLGNGTFERRHLHFFMDYFDSAMGASVADINGDGLLDVYFTSLELGMAARLQVDRFYPNAGISSSFEGNHLYVQDKHHLFVDVTEHSDVGHAGWSWGSVITDFNSDAWPDIVVVNGFDDPETTDDEWAAAIPNKAFRNLGPKANFKFESVAADIGLADKRDARAVLEMDFDKDGDGDLLVINHGGQPALYQNRGGNYNAWLRVTPRESTCSRPVSRVWPAPVDTLVVERCTPRISVGARVYVQVSRGAKEFMREIVSNAAFMAHSELTAHFGLGAGVRTVHRVRIVWPARNASMVLYNVPARHHLVLFAPEERSSHVTWAEQLAIPACAPARVSLSHTSEASKLEVRGDTLIWTSTSNSPGAAQGVIDAIRVSHVSSPPAGPAAASASVDGKTPVQLAVAADGSHAADFSTLMQANPTTIFVQQPIGPAKPAGGR